MIKILFWLSGFLPVRYINDGERQYLERYYLCTILGWQFYLHRFVDSDPDMGFHDHPWRKAFSIILAGKYIEHTRYGYKNVKWFNTLVGDSFHRVIIDSECWTLFAHTKEKAKPWGFLMSSQDGDHIYKIYDYSREGGQKDWWKTAGKRIL